MFHPFFTDDAPRRRHERGEGRRGFGGRGEGSPEGFGFGKLSERGERGMRHPFGHKGGGGRERMFDSGDLQLVILKLLAERPSYGYELIKALEERLAGGYAPSPGVVYPTLTMLEERGFAEVQRTEGNRKVYGITTEGEAELTANSTRVTAIFERLENRGRRFGRERSPELMRAMGDLRESIGARMMRDNLTPEQAAKIAEIIHQAARNIDSL
ncbi:MAG: PadR family transcriptional regulator [Acidobacteriaceae bacterium]|nr:PadR family transcriptional regulator [Acidobacteriaceae bacterium]